MTAVALRAEPAEDRVRWLRARLDMGRLIGWGWNPDSRVWTIDPADDMFSYRACLVVNCDYPTGGGHGLCGGCQRRWQAGPLTLEAFTCQPVERKRWRAERLCRVCCVPGHQRPVASGGLCLACDGFRRHRNQDVEHYVSGDERFEPAKPRPTIGFCTVGRHAR